MTRYRDFNGRRGIAARGRAPIPGPILRAGLERPPVEIVAVPRERAADAADRAALLRNRLRDPGGHAFAGEDSWGRFAWVRLADDARVVLIEGSDRILGARPRVARTTTTIAENTSMAPATPQ